jgi:hypothetical protein
MATSSICHRADASATDKFTRIRDDLIRAFQAALELTDEELRAATGGDAVEGDDDEDGSAIKHGLIVGYSHQFVQRLRRIDGVAPANFNTTDWKKVQAEWKKRRGE